MQYTFLWKFKHLLSNRNHGQGIEPIDFQWDMIRYGAIENDWWMSRWQFIIFKNSNNSLYYQFIKSCIIPCDCLLNIIYYTAVLIKPQSISKWINSIRKGRINKFYSVIKFGLLPSSEDIISVIVWSW